MDENLMSSQTNANALVSGRLWRFVQYCMNKEFQLWTADYWCPDGDGIELYIADTYFELNCFSGIGQSRIIMHDIEFSYLQDKVNLDFRESFDVQCCKIADYFCRLFCEYREAGNACR